MNLYRQRTREKLAKGPSRMPIVSVFAIAIAAFGFYETSCAA